MKSCTKLNPITLFLLKIKRSRKYRLINSFCLILNLVILALYHDQPEESSFQRTYNIMIFITSFYLLKTLLKLTVKPLRIFVSKPWNIIHLIVTICYVFIIIFNKDTTYKEYNSRPHHIQTIEKFFRVSGVALILKKAQSVKNLVRTLYFSVPLLLDISLILLLVFFIFAVIGCLLFEEVKTGDIVDDYINFKNLFYGMMTLFKCSTKEDWSQIMWDSYKIEPNCTRNVNCGSSKPLEVVWGGGVYIFIINLFVNQTKSLR